jgi:hypothetical protein
MLSTVLAVSWEPTIRGILVVLVMFVVLIGGTYLLLGTNLGARLGFMVALAGLSGWMMSMAIIWAVYGIGLQGPMPSWKPAEPAAIVRDAAFLDRAAVIEGRVDVAGLSAPVASDKVREQMTAEGWKVLDESDPRRGQAIAAADDLLVVQAEEFSSGEYTAVNVFDRGGERWPKINESLDFLAFFHDPRYAVVEVASLVPQRTEPGRAPARPVIDEAQPHRYVVMIRDLGARRLPALLIAAGSAVIFFLMCWLLHRREAYVRSNLALESPAA